jgi:hypothetical protein
MVTLTRRIGKSRTIPTKRGKREIKTRGKAFRDVAGNIRTAKPTSRVRQSLLIPRDKFTKREAIRLVRRKGAIVKNVQITKNFFRIRQVNPSLFRKETFRTVQAKGFPKGVLAVGGRIKQR